MNKNKLIISGVIILIVIVIAGLFLIYNPINKQEVSTENPIDIVSDFYTDWLRAVQDTSTDPYQEGLHQFPLLSKELRNNLKNNQQSQDGIDPVLCQSEIPTRNAMRIVYETENESEILVTARPSELLGQAIVKVLRKGDGWYINDIRCAPGEFGIDREFTFDRDGNLLKSVPPPYDPQYWHVVFEENGQKGHAAPLLFDDQSKCNISGEDGSVCNPDTFIEAAKVRVKGEMTESGIEVKFIEFKK